MKQIEKSMNTQNASGIFNRSSAKKISPEYFQLSVSPFMYISIYPNIIQPEQEGQEAQQI